MHITSGTSGATAADSPVDNSANVTTTIGGVGSASASIEVRGAAIDIAKTADNTSVSSGYSIGFRVTIMISDAGTAGYSTVSDPLPTDAGTSWSIDSSTEPSCQIVEIGRASCRESVGPSAFFTLHITSGTSGATAADSPVDNTANVTTTNDGVDSASASIEVRGAAIDIAKTADNTSVSAGDTIGFTVVVMNDGDSTALNVTVSDPLPTDAGTSWSIDSSTEPSCQIV